MITAMIMSGNEEVATIDEQFHVTDFTEKAPLLIQKDRFSYWLKERIIDHTRTHSRLLKKIFGFSGKSEQEISFHMHARCVTDNFWIRFPEEEHLTFEQIEAQFTDEFYTVALSGDSSKTDLRTKRLTFDLTTNGSLEKGWKKDTSENEWILIKNEWDQNRALSELISADISRAFGLKTAKYFYIGDRIVGTKDFTEGKYNFEFGESFCYEEEDVKVIYSIIKEINTDIASDYLKMIYVDCIIHNQDRHNQNWGVLRSKETGEILSLAPNYDFDVTLLFGGYQELQNTDKLTLDMKEFCDLLVSDKFAYKQWHSLHLPCLSKEQILNIICKYPLTGHQEELCNYIYGRQKVFNQHIKEL